MLGRREFVKLMGASVALLEGGGAIAGEPEGAAPEEEWFFDGTGLPEASKPAERVLERRVKRPLWLRRDGDEYRIDIATKSGYEVARWVLRDVQAKKMGHPDLGLLSGLSIAQTALASLDLHSRFDFTSGLRTRETNSKIEGAAQASQHLPDAQGFFKAADLRARGFDAAFTAKLMGIVGMGGIGIYHVRDFVHVDTGRRRTWRGK